MRRGYLAAATDFTVDAATFPFGITIFNGQAGNTNIALTGGITATIQIHGGGRAQIPAGVTVNPATHCTYIAEL